MKEYFFDEFFDYFNLCLEGLPEALVLNYRFGDLSLIYEEAKNLNLKFYKFRIGEELKFFNGKKFEKQEGYEDPVLLFKKILNEKEPSIYFLEGFEYLEQIQTLDMLLEDIINSNNKTFIIFLVLKGKALPFQRRLKEIDFQGPKRRIIYDLIDEAGINFNNYQKACLTTALEGLTLYFLRKVLLKVKQRNLDFEKAVVEAIKTHFEEQMPFGIEVFYPEDINIENLFLIEKAINYLKDKSQKPILLLGPPGSGKTTLPFAWAKLEKKFLYIARTQILRSKYVGETEKNFLNLFNELKNLPSGILLFDEYEKIISADALSPELDSGLGLRVQALFLEFLAKPSHHKIILTANNVNYLSEAELRRFNSIFLGYIPKEILLDFSKDLTFIQREYIKVNIERFSNKLNWQDIEAIKKGELNFLEVLKNSEARFSNLSSIFKFQEERGLKNLWEAISQKGGEDELLAYSKDFFRGKEREREISIEN